MNGFITATISFLSSYTFFNYFTHPKKKKHKVPHFKFWRIEILPNFKIHFQESVVHVHHWILLSAFFVFLIFIYEGFQLVTIKSLTLGGIVQGLRYKDRFQFRLRKIKRH